jgi:hypothetical protein
MTSEGGEGAAGPTSTTSTLLTAQHSSPPAMSTGGPVLPHAVDEPEVPLADPFLVDDPESPTTPVPSPALDRHQSVPVTSVALPPASPNIHKAVPPPPVHSDDDDEMPELSLPGLVVPTMFLPIPNVRILPVSFHLLWWLHRL